LESFPGFNETIKKAIDQPSKEIREKLVDLLARVFMVGGNYILIDPHDVSNDWKFMMNRTNINRFLKAFMAHVETISKQPIIG
jgi:hypothetical protein